MAEALLECIRAEGRKVDAGRGKAITASIGIADFGQGHYLGRPAPLPELLGAEASRQ